MFRKRAALEVSARAYLRVFGVDVPEPPPPPPLQPGAAGVDPNAPGLGFSDDDPLDPAWTGPVPSPRWAVAAAARIGLEWAGFDGEFRRVPLPRSWEAEHACLLPDCIRDDLNDSAEHPVARIAKLACEESLRLAVQHRIEDAEERACEAWLSRWYRYEHPPFEELLPRLSTPVVGSGGAPILIGGRS